MCAYRHNNYETLLCRKLPQAHELYMYFFLKKLRTIPLLWLLCKLYLYLSQVFLSTTYGQTCQIQRVKVSQMEY